MDKKIISTEKAPAAVGPYSQGVSAGSITFFSGQLGIDPATGKLPEGVRQQAEQSLKNIRALLDTIGAGPSDIVKTTVYLADMADFAAVNEVYARFFEGPCPARSCVAVKALPLGGLVEIEITVAQ